MSLRANSDHTANHLHLHTLANQGYRTGIACQSHCAIGENGTTLFALGHDPRRILDLHSVGAAPNGHRTITDQFHDTLPLRL